MTPASVLPLRLLRRLCTAAEMRKMDSHTIETLGVPGQVLMEDAAHQVAAEVQRLLRGLDRAGPIAVCCGAGNNGGDGYAAARLLRNAGLPALVIRSGEAGTADARANARAWSRFGPLLDFDTQAAEAENALRGSAAIVDAVFGTGLARPIEGPALELIARMNASPAPVKVAVDVPSGVNADTGAVLGAAVRCTHTVCFQVGKIGLYQYPGAEFAGRVRVVPVSIQPRWPEGAPGVYRLTRAFARALLPARPAAGHKGTFGHLLAICGSAGMAGAALLCGLAALKSGAGLVTLAVPRALRDGFLAAAPELMTLAPSEGGADHFEAAHAEALAGEAQARGAVVLGCGLGRAPQTAAFVKALVPRLAGPLLVDADGLFHLDPELLRGRAQPAILTPHPGELSRLSGVGREQLAEDRVGHARRWAAQWGVVLVLKGAGTVVAAPTGEAFINPTGDAGLATGGTGDVLSGLIGSLLAQGLEPLAAALLGVYLHGLARDGRRAELTGAAFTAMDLVRGLNTALHNLGER
jgi:NAD(P)H-hydrate epimerase